MRCKIRHLRAPESAEFRQVRWQKKIDARINAQLKVTVCVLYEFHSFSMSTPEMNG